MRKRVPFHNVMAAVLLMVSLLGSLTAQALETITYYHNDLAGNPLAATDESGNLLWKENYRPYGEQVKKEDGGTNSDWFTGKPYESSTGLSYFGARHYDPAIGRFMGIDPQGVMEDNLHSFNRYGYGNNNPYRFVDPDGRTAHAVVGGVILFGLVIALEPIEMRNQQARSLRQLFNAIGNVIWNANSSETESAGTQGAATSAGTSTDDAEQGCIYCVKGDKTKSGKDYVGSTDDLDKRKRDKTDGRNREGAEVIDTYTKGDRATRRGKEQKAINDRGGIDKLDNKRNEIAPRDWPANGISPPNN